jgi:hypothetical protein
VAPLMASHERLWHLRAKGSKKAREAEAAEG